MTNSRVAINYRRSLHSFQFLQKKIFWTTKRRQCPRRAFNPHLHAAPISRCQVSRDRYKQIVREEFSAAVNQWHDPILGHFPFKRNRTRSNYGFHTFIIFISGTILCSAIKETLCNHLLFLLIKDAKESGPCSFFKIIFMTRYFNILCLIDLSCRSIVKSL